MRLMSQLVAAAVLTAGAVALVQAEEATTKPAKKEMHGPRLVQPYSKMTTLTPDEKEKIFAIHEKFKADMKALEMKEDADVAALLTEPQKAELEQIKHEAKVKGKTKDAEKKAAPTTAPSHGM